ncbi:MAG: CTP synthase [Desulfurococcaceae archaeon]
MAKYVFVTGGVLSGLGKGIVTASIGLLLKSMGYNVTAIKIDPYLNVDAGTMSPYAHGEVFVTEDGGETDMDIGHYERFLNVNLSRKNNITSGQVYYNVILKERRGDYLGQCVQIIPHVTDEIKFMIRNIAQESGADIAIVEIGGTVGDIEGLPYQEAARQIKFDVGESNVFYVHVALAPILPSGELKTKPIQHSVQELRRIGIQPDAIVVRSARFIDNEARSKIALYSNLPPRAVFSNPDLEHIYEVPLILHEQGFTKYIAERLRLDYREPELPAWREFVNKLKTASRVVKIAMIGKYTKIRDSYVSIIEAIKHSSAWKGVKPELLWIESTDIEGEQLLVRKLDAVDGAIILPGFGRRGAEGKILAIKYLREHLKPVLGICFGMQLMIIEAFRNIIGLSKANSTELDPNTPYPVVDLLPEQRNLSAMGGTLRLGARKILIKPGTWAYRAYGTCEVYERFRHRYGFNNKYIDLLEKAGLEVSGYSEEGYAEIVELKNTKTLYLGIQAHPEFKSRPLQPSPIFSLFIDNVLQNKHVD